MSDQNIKNATPTQLLVSCLEDFGTSEPTTVLVIYINEKGELCWQSTPAHLAVRVGMVEMCKHFLLSKI